MNLRRNRAAALVLISAAVLVLTGCAAPGSGADASGQSVRKTIVFDFPYTSLPVYGQVLAAATKEASKTGYQLLTTEDQGAQDKQVSNLTTMTNRGVGAIVSFPIEPTALANVMQVARDAGTKWITYGTSMKNENGSIDLGGYDSGVAIAKAAGVWAEAHTGGKGKVLVIGTSTNDLGRQRTKGMLDGLAEYAPGLKVIKEETVKENQTTAITQARLSTDPDINFLIATTDDDAIGAVTALREGGLDPKTTFVGGNDGTLPVLKSIQSGTDFFKATSALSIDQIGKLIVDSAAEAINGKDPGRIVARPIVLTKDSPEMATFIRQAQ